MEGYKFCNGNIMQLTRPQILFLKHLLELKASLRAGKKPGPSQTAKAGQASSGGGYTPEQLAAKMIPKFEKMDKDALDSEIAAADSVMKTWERKQREKQQTPCL
jgi:hypothetical protein